jgi:putative methyltransferase (TIGR04325 family)
MSAWQWFRGDYATWQEARSASAGYDDPAILERVARATRQVAAGEAAFERDGVAFEREFVHAPLLAALRSAADARQGRLRVLDFGGSLGSACWQHRRALADLVELEWHVVEQPHYVAAGRREFAGEELRFHTEIAAATSAGAPDLVLASSVLQYVPDPWRTLDRLLEVAAPRLFLDRIPLLPAGPDRLTVEDVPPELGETSYPAWFLEERRLLAAVGRRYELVERFVTTLENGLPESWQVFGTEIPNQGFSWRRR